MFEAGAIAYRLQMVGAQVFTAEAARADAAVDKLGRSAQRSATNIELSGQRALAASRSYGQLSADGERAFGTLGRVFIGAGLAAAAMVALSVYKFAQYDRALSSLDSVVKASDDDLQSLGDTAIDAGRQFGYTAVQAIGAEEALAKAGVGTSDILGGALVGSLTLAAAGTLDVGQAAEVASIAMIQFKREGKDVPHIADLLAAGAGKAVGDVDDLALALRQGGLVAAQFKIPLEDTVGTLAAFAANGLIGSDAGTSFKQMLLSLATPSVKQAQIMKELGISAYDASGQFVGITKFAGILQDKLGTLTDAERQNALGWIFGSDAIRSATVLYNEGADGIQKWIDETNDSGYAADQARRKLDNLSGDVNKLGSSFDRALIKSGSAANDTLRDLVQTVTFLVDAFGDLDPEQQKVALSVTAGTAAVLILTGVIFTSVPKVLAFNDSLKVLGLTMGRTAATSAGLGLALGAVLLVIGQVVEREARWAQVGDNLTDSIDKTTGAFTRYSRELVANEFKTSGAAETAKAFGIDLKTLTDAAFGNADAIALIQDRTEKFGSGGGAGAAGQKIRDLRAEVEAMTQKVSEAPGDLAEMEAATNSASDSASNGAGDYSDLQEAVDGVVTSVKDLAQELGKLNGQNLDAREAQRQLEQAYDDFDATIKKNGKTLDIHTQAGRENQAALDDIAKAALDSGQAIVDAGGSYADYRASLEASRSALLDRIHDLGLSGDKAESLADQILRIPSETEWEAIVKTDNAQLTLDNFVKDNQGRTIAINVANTRNFADGGIERPVLSFAGGGEHHVAQIARAGAIRIWNEPETGGESYIPWAKSKRARATQVLADTAAGFGYQLVPIGAQAFADGGTTAPTVAGSREQRRTVSGTVRIIDERTGVLELIEEELR